MQISSVIREGVAAVIVAFVSCASVAWGQDVIYEEVPGQREFTGEMLVRPLQVEDWMRRGLTEEQARRRHREVSDWLVNFLDHRFFNYSPFFDRYDFRLDQRFGRSMTH